MSQYTCKMYVEVRVKLSSKKESVVQPSATGKLLVYIHEPPVDGKANVAVIKLLANYYKVPKSRISIVRGQTSRIKIVHIADSE